MADGDDDEGEEEKRNPELVVSIWRKKRKLELAI
jgi:hypothetical protein